MYKIIHTDFLTDICDQLIFSAYNIGNKRLAPCPDWLAHHFDLACEIVRQNINRITTELAEVDEYDDYPTDLKDELTAECNLLIDLSILQDLEGVDYANPYRIALSIEILSAKLTEQLEAKANEEAHYNEYYCRSLARCLAELCTLLKEV